jgi:DNA-directed RNA polymerase subunit E'/Rpb7
MEQTVLFEEKVYLSPKDMNNIKQESLDSILHKLIKHKLEKKCNQHGFVVPNSIEVLSRSMGQLESGKFTGNIIFYIQAQGKVYNPANGTKVIGQILKKNKMGLYIIYKNAIRILVPRDLHIGKENIDFESLEPGNVIEVEIRKSRFQINDQFILSIATFVRRASESDLEEDFEYTSELPEQNKKTFMEEAAEEQANESSEEDQDSSNEDEEVANEESEELNRNNAVNESIEEDNEDDEDDDIDQTNENLEFEIK